MEIKISQYDGDEWVVVETAEVFSETVKEYITIPQGFVTDLASIPRLLWSLLPPFGKYSTPAIVHDYLYRHKKYKRKTCDLIFKELMVKCNVSKWKVRIMYLSVRWFGKKYFGSSK